MPLRLATWPPPNEFARVPYLVSFYDAVKRFGVVPVSGLVADAEWILANRRHVDAIHIHWPDGLWTRATKGSIPAQLKKALAMRRFLQTAHKAGLKIIWTVHNSARHDGARFLDRYCYRVLAREVDLFICHSRWSAAMTADAYSPKGQIAVMPIGAFPGAYPEPRPRDVVLRELGLADRPTVCAVGNIKLYKGLDVACDAVMGLKGRVQLIIGGRPGGRPVDVAKLRETLFSTNAGIVIDRVLAPQEFSDIIGASEAVLLPYRNITGSAALLTAWTLGRGVIASDLPYFREMVGSDGDAGRLFSGNGAAMGQAIEAYLKVPLESRAAAARRMGALYSWDRCVEPLREILNAWRSEHEFPLAQIIRE